jgi:hypothetical protein
VVECFLAKEDVAGSTPVSRSKSIDPDSCVKLEQTIDRNKFVEDLDTRSLTALRLQFSRACS